MSVVTFGSVMVREFERIAGDHPDTPRGPSLTIGWGFIQHEAVPIAVTPEKETLSKVLDPLNAETRRFLLAHVFDVSKQDIEESEEVAEEIRKQRRESYWAWKQNLDDSQAEEEDVEETEDESEFSAEFVHRRPRSKRASGVRPEFLRSSRSKPKSNHPVKRIYKDLKRSVRANLTRRF